MSVWSAAKGVVEGDFLDHFSLKKYTNTFVDLGYEIIFSVDYGAQDVLGKNPRRIDEFYLSVCLDGQQAMDFFTKWMEGIPGHVDMTIELRMMKASRIDQ